MCYVLSNFSHVQLLVSLWTVACQSPLYGIFQAKILGWVAISSSRGSYPLKSWTHISFIGREILYQWTTWEAQINDSCHFPYKFLGICMETGSLGQDTTPAKKETKEAQLLFSSQEGLVYAIALKYVGKFLYILLLWGSWVYFSFPWMWDGFRDSLWLTSNE